MTGEQRVDLFGYRRNLPLSRLSFVVTVERGTGRQERHSTHSNALKNGMCQMAT